MPNDISLTVRLPHELNMQLKTASREIGVTKTNFIRSSIHDFLTKDDIILDLSQSYTDNKDRLVLNVNQLTYSILQDACHKYGESMNMIITAVCVLGLKRSAKWLQSAKK